LGLLVRIPTLLEELLILSRILSLLRLLTERTRRDLSLSTLKTRRLSTRAKTRNLLTGLHHTGKVLSLNALLTRCCLNSLLVSLSVQRRDCLASSQVLLALKHRPLDTRTLATERPALDGVCLLLRKLLALLLLESAKGWVNNALDIGVHVGANLTGSKRPNSLRTSKRQAGSHLIVRLG
jgi:hypothetical protein